MKKFKDLKEEIINNNKFINDTDKLVSIVNKFKGVSPTSKALDYVNNNVMPVKIGNEKIGDDTLINDNNYVICCGVCSNCSYCKNKQEKRTVIFVNHKNKSTKKILKEVLSKKDLIKLEALKLRDYSNFLLDNI